MISNGALWVSMLLLSFLSILSLYRFFGPEGLYVWVAIATILANIQVMKLVEIFGITTTLGNVLYATTYVATDILSENHGKKAANRAVGIGFVAILSLIVFMNMALLFKPSGDDFSQKSLLSIFSIVPRVGLASLVAYLVAQLTDVRAYHFWKRRDPRPRSIWLRNNASTMMSQLIDTALFTYLAFWGIFSPSICWQLFLTSYLLKWFVALMDTPLLYIAYAMRKKVRP